MQVIIHSRSNFYERNLPIYWYEFLIDGSNILIDAMIGNRFIRVPETKYYEFGGNHTEAIQTLTDAGVRDIVEGIEI